FRIAGFLLLVDQTVHLGMLKTDPLGSSRAVILIVHGVGIDSWPAHIVERSFSAVDAIRSPEDGKFLRDQLGFNAGFGELIGNNLADLAGFRVTVRREIKLHVETVGETGLRK